MDVKIDTKEKFSVITPKGPILHANMTDEVVQLLRGHQQKDPPHVILNLKDISDADASVLRAVSEAGQYFRANNASFVVCGAQTPLKKKLEDLGLWTEMNTTPTESEAWDIVQMEEIERELLNGDDA